MRSNAAALPPAEALWWMTIHRQALPRSDGTHSRGTLMGGLAATLGGLATGGNGFWTTTGGGGAGGGGVRSAGPSKLGGGRFLTSDAGSCGWQPASANKPVNSPAAHHLAIRGPLCCNPDPPRLRDGPVPSRGRTDPC